MRDEIDFIFMLTRDDRTVADAASHLETALAAGIRHIGFKDIGLPFEDLAALTARIRSAGATAYLEVVSLDRPGEIASVKAGIGLNVDRILGGVHVEDVLPLIQHTAIGYYPFAGQVRGHPSLLEGSHAEIAGSAAALTRHEGVSGIDLLAWRSRGDAPALIDAVCRVTDKPVIVAGSIDSPGRIGSLRAAGAAGFTVGTAALEGRFPAPSTALADQLSAIASAAGAARFAG
ncbi:MAG: 4-hydroxythreonine-4-phosphate dehydrogenase [Rhizobiaceae bacterium]|nr:4-hydroxythreonine-4-phosphate dehydrogenase [Rhizobiaceae bacterium]